MRQFRDSWVRSGSMLCVGLDPTPARFPAHVGRSSASIRAFNHAIIDATSDLVCCYKPNLGFYLPHGHDGLDALLALREDVPAHIPLLLDAKVGDVGTTTEAYASAYFDTWGFDGVTAHAYMGHDSLAPLLSREGHAVFVLAKTSNPGSGLLQDQMIDGVPVSEIVAAQAATWNSRDNVGLVAGATYPEQLRSIRSVAGDMPILVPGVGAQQGDLAAAVRSGLDSSGFGLIINASRAVCYASDGPDFAEAARAVALRLRDEIEQSKAASLQTV